jgi:hypothetical protein
MRDNMLVNLTGLVGHCMPIDLNIEHLIGFLKASVSGVSDLPYLSLAFTVPFYCQGSLFYMGTTWQHFRYC